MSLFLTKHAQRQAQRRGISAETINLVYEEADIRDWSGDGCRSLQITRKRLFQMVARGNLKPCLAEKASGISLVMASDGAIVTVMHKTKRSKLRKYSPKKNKTRRLRTEENTRQFKHDRFPQLYPFNSQNWPFWSYRKSSS